MESKNIIIGIMILVVVVCAGVISVIIRKPDVTPDVEAKEFLTQITTGQTEIAYNDASEKFKAIGPVEAFNDFITKNIGTLTATDITISSRSFESENGRTTADFEGTMTMSDGTSITITMNLEKFDGIWKVVDFSLK